MCRTSRWIVVGETRHLRGHRGSTFKGRYFRPFQDLPCDPFETDGRYQVPAGDQALQLLQC